MKYTVNIEGVINDILKDNMGIGPALEKRCHERYHTKLPWYQPILELYDGLLPVRHWNAGPFLARLLLNESAMYPSPLYQLLFKSFVAAEGKFIRNYIPQNSHEERLTGHLVSELENGLFILHDSFEETAASIYGKPVPLNFYYADLSSNSQEKHTGADLGFIFYVNLPDLPKHIRIAAIQAKKAGPSSAVIDAGQLDTISRVYGDDAYYMFYDMTDRMSPMMRKAQDIKENQGDATGGKTFSYGRNRINQGTPLSIFLVFEMLLAAKEEDNTITNIWDAKYKLLNPAYERRRYDDDDIEARPSKVLAVSIGAFDRNDDLQGIGELFRGEFPRD
jgi:hypothetical protein